MKKKNIMVLLGSVTLAVAGAVFFLPSNAVADQCRGPIKATCKTSVTCNAPKKATCKTIATCNAPKKATCKTIATCNAPKKATCKTIATCNAHKNCSPGKKCSIQGRAVVACGSKCLKI